MLCVVVSVPPRKTRFPMDWRLLAKKHIANISIPLDNFFFMFDDFCVLNFHFVFANKPFVHNRGVISGTVCDLWLLALVTNDRWQVRCYMLHLTFDTWQMTHDTYSFYWICPLSQFSLSVATSVFCLFVCVPVCVCHQMQFSLFSVFFCWPVSLEKVAFLS